VKSPARAESSQKLAPQLRAGHLHQTFAWREPAEPQFGAKFDALRAAALCRDSGFRRLYRNFQKDCARHGKQNSRPLVEREEELSET